MKPIYIISGDEPLLWQEARQALLDQANTLGYEHQSYTAEATFNWAAFHAELCSPSLFSERRLIEIHIPTGKPGDKGAKFFRDYAKKTAPDVSLIILLPKIDASTQKSQWFSALKKSGEWVAVWPIKPHQLPSWISQRLAASGLSANRDAIALFAEHVAGNLLAAAQEIEKLKLIVGQGEITLQQMAEFLTPQSRTTIFELAEACLTGDTRLMQLRLRLLLQDGTEPTLILWALAREIRRCAQFATARDQRRSPADVCREHRIRDQELPLYQRAIKNRSTIHFYELLQQAQQCDELIKGARAGSIAQALSSLCEGWVVSVS